MADHEAEFGSAPAAAVFTTANTAPLRALEAKRIEKLAQLAALQQARVDAKSAPDVQDNKQLMLNEFAEAWQQQKQQIEQQLTEHTTATLTVEGSAAATAAAFRAFSFNLHNTHIAAVRDLLAEHSFNLPPHDLRTATAQLQSWQEQITKMEQLLIPKKKFGFAKKEPKAIPAATVEAAVIDPAATAAVAAAATPSAVSATDDIAGFVLQHRTGLEISHQQSCVIFADASVITGNDVSLSHLTDCVIVLQGSATQLRVDHLLRCVLLCGPINGSTLLVNAVDCQLMIASRQIRLHDAVNCDFYLHASSHPIIEHCDALRFAPYALHYDTVTEDFEKSKLALNVNLWDTVNDFNWLRAQQSPHWAVMPVTQRCVCVLPGRAEWPTVASVLTAEHYQQHKALLDTARDMVLATFAAVKSASAATALATTTMT